MNRNKVYIARRLFSRHSSRIHSHQQLVQDYSYVHVLVLYRLSQQSFSAEFDLTEYVK